MAGRRPGSIGICTLAAAFCVGAGAMLAAPAPALGQGLFDFLFGALRGAPPRAYQREAPRLLENFPGIEEEKAPAADPGGPYVAYCVRLCDGRYFPLPRNAGAPSMNPQKVCSAMCPAAQTRIFSGTQIERARASDGKDYSSLANAFLYRERLVTDCSCTDRDTSGIAIMDIEADPTLRPGDIVVTADGPKVFKGNRRTPHKTSDFVPPEEYRGLPKSVRRSLSDIRVAPERLSATVISGTSEPAERASTPALTMTPDGSDALQADSPRQQN